MIPIVIVGVSMVVPIVVAVVVSVLATSSDVSLVSAPAVSVTVVITESVHDASLISFLSEGMIHVVVNVIPHLLCFVLWEMDDFAV